VKKLNSFAALAALCCSLSSCLWAAPITYTFVDNSGFQSGHTLSGSITTDGTIGDISTENILNWNWTITNNATSAVAMTGSNANSSESDTQLAIVIASATQITMMQSPPTGAASGSGLLLFGPLGYVLWQRVTVDVNTGLPADRYLAEYLSPDGNEDNNRILWNNRADSATLSLKSNPSGAWVIAEASAVPELSTHCLIFSGLILAAVAVRRRKCKQS
jgi:hypothetical protein